MPTEDQLRQLPRDGITTDLQNGGKLEIEQQMAGMRPPAPLVFMIGETMASR
jgi:hypothetical protein